MEEWKDIIGYEGLYKINRIGEVYSYLTNKILKQSKETGNRYYKIFLRKEGYTKCFYVHRLIGIHFIPNPNNLPQIDHINSIRTDNRIENLQWVTAKENVYKSNKGNRNGSKNVGRKHTAEEIQKMKIGMLGKNKGKPSPFKGKKCCMVRDEKGKFIKKIGLQH